MVSPVQEIHTLSLVTIHVR